ncbi:hypothetical protein ACFFKU_03675 [Kineococcus gynurae]|uniref:Integral membrane protein n=1 Tax=Kineococcus gynurae TaxID=452979 RepID=A0ABV5LRT9_9ACTN
MSSTTPEPAQSEQPGPPEDEATEPEGTGFVQVTRRRAPRYRSFMVTGALIALAISGGIALTTPPSGGYSQQALFGYLLVSLGFFFVLLGGLLAVLSERRAIGRAPRSRRAGRRRRV